MDYAHECHCQLCGPYNYDPNSDGTVESADEAEAEDEEREKWSKRREMCVLDRRHLYHMEEVSALCVQGLSQTVCLRVNAECSMARSTAVVCLIVGSGKEEIECHRALLGYYSSFFDVALYGNFAEARRDQMELPADCLDTVSAFVKWIYTGVIDSNAPEAEHREADPVYHEKLWIFGDRIQSPKFMNSITELLFSKYMEGRAPPAVVDYIYENTQPGSTLRKLLTASVAAEGPLHPRYGHHAKEWNDLVWEGGDFVLDVVLSGGFTNWDLEGLAPRHNRRKYLHPLVYKLKALDWRKGEVV
jgi:BTB/POZ domain